MQKAVAHSESLGYLWLNTWMNIAAQANFTNQANLPSKKDVNNFAASDKPLS